MQIAWDASLQTLCSSISGILKMPIQEKMLKYYDSENDAIALDSTDEFRVNNYMWFVPLSIDYQRWPFPKFLHYFHYVCMWVCVCERERER